LIGTMLKLKFPPSNFDFIVLVSARA
jgi:hypothetical protein